MIFACDWQKLLHRAGEILDGAGIPPGEWVFGGGTALAYRFRHRTSKDIDIFLRDAQYLLLITPRLNSSAGEGMIGYEETALSVKIAFPEGEVDFIIAPQLTGEPHELVSIGGREVFLESPVETVIKKLFYRAETLKTRDLVDVSAALNSPWRDALLASGCQILTNRLEALKKRFEYLKKVYAGEVERLDILMPRIREKAPEDFAGFLEQIQKCASVKKSAGGEFRPRI